MDKLKKEIELLKQQKAELIEFAKEMRGLS